MKEELQSILDHFEYDKALSWYCKHVQGKFFLKEMLGKGADPYNVLKLKKELVLALESLPVNIIAQEIKKKKSKPSDIENQIENLRDEIEDLTYKIEDLEEKRTKPKIKVVEQAAITREEMELDEEWKPLYKEANHYFEQIGHVKDVQERKEMAFKILDIMDQVEESWKAKDFLKTHGQMPNFDNAGMEQLTAQQIGTRIRTIRTYISKAKKGKLDPAKVPAWEMEIAELERRQR